MTLPADDMDMQKLSAHSCDIGKERKRAAVAWRTLGIRYRDRQDGDRAANLERAIVYFATSLAWQDAEQDPYNWGVTQSHLARSYLARLRDDRAQNIETAIGCARDAVERTAVNPKTAAHVEALHALGAAYLMRSDGEHDTNIEEAIGCLEQALRLAQERGDVLVRAKITSDLADAYAWRDHGDIDANCETGIGYIEQALRDLEGPLADPMRSVLLRKLTRALLGRRRGDPAENVDRAGQSFVAAEELGHATLTPVELLKRLVAKARAILVVTPERRREAKQQLDRAFDLFNVIWAESVTPEARKEVVGAISEAGRCAALVHVAMGEHAKGLERLELTRAIMLREALAGDARGGADMQRETTALMRRRIAALRNEAGALRGAPGRYVELAKELKAAQAVLDGVPAAGWPLDIDAILAATPAGNILLVPVETSCGSLVFVVPAGTTRLDTRHVVQLPHVSSGAVEDRLAAWLKAYADALAVSGTTGSRPMFEQRWHVASDALAEVLDWLGQEVMKPVLDRVGEFRRLADSGVPGLVIMPTGSFAMLPLHAAMCTYDGEKRAVLEDYVVSYTASLHALRMSRERESRLALSSVSGELLALVNPTGDLPFSESVEIPALRRLFPNAGREAIRVGAAATKAALTRYARGQRYIHLSCHGRFAEANPDESGLSFADGEWLTIREIDPLLELDCARWVMLAGCETAMTDVRHIPDEVVGLVAAFQMAGASCVIGSLWAVPDASAALFATKVYEGHLSAGLAPAMALRQAALWLRELSAGELAHLVQRNDQLDAGALRFAEIGAAEPAAKYPPSGSKPFRSPLFWAAFAAWGV